MVNLFDDNIFEYPIQATSSKELMAHISLLGIDVDDRKKALHAYHYPLPRDFTPSIRTQNKPSKKTVKPPVASEEIILKKPQGKQTEDLENAHHLAQQAAEKADSIDALINAFATLQSETQLQKMAEKTIFYSGQTKTDLLVIGEIPTKDDEIKASPFSGESSNSFHKLLSYLGYGKNGTHQTAFAHLLPWRPYYNNLSAEHYLIGVPFIHRLITLLNPQKIILTGGMTANIILGLKGTLISQRGNIYPFTLEGHEYNIMVSLNPSYLKRVPMARKLFWFDLLKYVT